MASLSLKPSPLSDPQIGHHISKPLCANKVKMQYKTKEQLKSTYENEYVQSEVFNKKSINVLNVGCGIPIDFFDFVFHEVSVESLVGVELKKSELEVVQTGQNRRFFKDCFTYKDCYFRYHEYQKNLNSGENEFESERFDRNWGVCKFYYDFNVCEERFEEFVDFDLVLVNQLLHFFPKRKQEEILRKVIDCISQGSLLYMIANLKTNPSFKNENEFKECEDGGFENVWNKKKIYPCTISEYIKMFDFLQNDEISLIRESLVVKKKKDKEDEYILGVWRKAHNNVHDDHVG